MAFVFPKDFMEVWKVLVDAIKNQTIFTGGETIQAAYSFFNTQPELRNPPNQPRYPGIVLTTMSPVESPDWIVQERVKYLVDVTAAAPYLEGVKAPTLALADGQTLEITRGYLNAGQPDEEILIATFQTAQFADITQATPAEIAAVLDALVGVSASVVAGDTVRLLHDDAASTSTLQITGGTAAALIATFPAYQVIGRDAGKEQQARRPVTHYHFPFQLGTLAKRADDDWILKKFVESLFREDNSPRERSLQISTRKFEVRPARPVDDPLATAGEFATTYPFTLYRVPIAWDAASFEGDNFNGGNYDGTGVNPRSQEPIVASFEFNLDTL